MIFKHILVPVLSLSEDEPALSAAASLAEAFGAKVAALVIEIGPASEFAGRAAPLSEVLSDFADGLAGGEDERLAAWLQKSPAPFERRELGVSAAILDHEAVAHARLSDITVMTRGSHTARAHRILLEGFLFQSGRPVLLMPDAPPPGAPIGERILVAWKPGREAVRAVHDALPLLARARAVAVATVDATPSASGYGEAPGFDLAALLARHSVTVEVRNVDGLGRSEDQALLDEAGAIGADLIVMGGYGRSRAEERLFGGVTRALLGHAPVALYLSH